MGIRSSENLPGSSLLEELTPLAAATAAFVLWHLVVASTAVREPLIRRLGRLRFAGLFSAGALAGLAAMVMTYGNAPYVELWAASTSVRHLSLSVMPVACILVVAGASTPNPSTVGMDMPAARVAEVSGILTVTRHPLMWGIGLFGLCHMLANGDAASQILFGGVAFLALYGTRRLDAKKRRSMGERWRHFEDATSNLPFAAIIQKCAVYDFPGIGWPRVIGGLALYVVLLLIHGEAFGVVPWAV